MTTRVSATEYEAGLFASVDVMADVTAFSSANQLSLVVHMTFLDVTHSWLFGRVLADTYAKSNTGTIESLTKVKVKVVQHLLL